jgi:hypothetical protein
VSWVWRAGWDFLWFSLKWSGTGGGSENMRWLGPEQFAVFMCLCVGVLICVCVCLWVCVFVCGCVCTLGYEQAAALCKVIWGVEDWAPETVSLDFFVSKYISPLD